MTQKEIAAVKGAIDGARALDIAEQVSRFHRIQASADFRRAAKHVIKIIQDLGIEAELLSWPADGKARTNTTRILREWDITAGNCMVEGFGEIANFFTEPMSILPRSIACDFAPHGLELVYLDKSSDINDYDGLDLKNKLVFVRENYQNFTWAVEKRGAAGIITDYVLHPDKQQDVIRYTSFWWKEEPEELTYYAFALAPCVGKRLAEFLVEKRERGEKAIARGYIASSRYDGELNGVSAFLPGKSEQEILIAAHLCHPNASANDNASGVAAAIEALAALKAASENGDITLERGVRILLIPEMSGTVEYVAGNAGRIENTMAAINLDMVGAKQAEGYGPLTLSSLPRAAASFTEYAAMLALEAASSIRLDFLGEVLDITMKNIAVADFAPGSDHYILSDPTVGVPCTMLGQWPDPYYHTSGDTVDRLCPEVLACSAGTAALFAMQLAGLREGDLPQLLSRGRLRLADELNALGASIESGKLAKDLADAAYWHITEAHRAAVRDIARFLPGTDAIIADECRRIDSLLAAFCPASAEKPVSSDMRVPRRLYQMPVQELDHSARVSGQTELYEQYKAACKDGPKNMHTFEAVAQYYIDGRRTVGDVVALTALDMHLATPLVAQFIGLLAACGLVEFV